MRSEKEIKERLNQIKTELRKADALSILKNPIKHGSLLSQATTLLWVLNMSLDEMISLLQNK